MAPGKAMLRRHVRNSKYEPVVDEVDVIEVNPTYAVVRHGNGRESSVALKDLSPHHNPISDTETPMNADELLSETVLDNNVSEHREQDVEPTVQEHQEDTATEETPIQDLVRRSQRSTAGKPPAFYQAGFS